MFGYRQRKDLIQWIEDRAKVVFSQEDKDLAYKCNQIAINAANHFEEFLKSLFRD